MNINKILMGFLKFFVAPPPKKSWKWPCLHQWRQEMTTASKNTFFEISLVYSFSVLSIRRQMATWLKVSFHVYQQLKQQNYLFNLLFHCHWFSPLLSRTWRLFSHLHITMSFQYYQISIQLINLDKGKRVRALLIYMTNSVRLKL
jgi:hypothetical protein